MKPRTSPMCVVMLLSLLSAPACAADRAPQAFGRSLDSWREEMNTSDSGRRATSVAVIGLMGDAGRPVVIEALSDDDAAVRAVAAEVLARHGAAAKSALPRLRAMLDDKSPGVALAAAYAICRVDQPSKRAMQILIDALAAPDRAMPTRAADYLGWIGPPAAAALPALEEAAKHKDYHVWGAALIAIDKIKPTETSGADSTHGKK